jgi:pyruvate dehydrogenase E2 component (dihydrolipoamide acetyltransferase)
MADVKQFKLPDVGEGLTEAEIVKWHVSAGDTVEVHQTIVEIETAKAIVELPCPFDGVVTELMVEEGVTVDVGTPIIAVDTAPGSGTGAPANASSSPSSGAPSPTPTTPDSGEALLSSPTETRGSAQPQANEPGTVGSVAPKVDPGAPEQQKRQPVLVGYGVKPGATQRRARKQAHATGSPQPVDNLRGGVTVLAKPPVRKLAKDLGVDLRTLTGSGPQGSITRDDVQAAVRSVPTETPPTQPPARVVALGEREERIPVKGVRKHTAAAMVQSAFTAPHVTEFLQVDVTETMAAVKRLRQLPDFADVKVSPLLLVAKAVLVAAARHPMINSAWDEAAQEIVIKRYVNLGIAAATERGLIVPNIKDAQALSLPDLALALQSLADTARAGKAQPADLSGGTLTITNVGVFGVDAGTPILTPGESAILAFGQVRDMPWVHEDEIKIRKVTTLALSFDHRIVDGELGSRFLRDVGTMLEDPLSILAWT